MQSLTLPNLKEVLDIANDVNPLSLDDDDLNSILAIKTVEGLEASLKEHYKKRLPLILRIENMSEEEFTELCALVWLGRGDWGTKEEWDDIIRYANNAKPVTNYLIGKKPLPKYILQGLEKLGLIEEFRSFDDLIIQKKQGSYFQSVKDVFSELRGYLIKHPEAIFSLSPRKFEELISDILRDMGYETSLTNTTRDGGRDILAYLATPLGNILTIVECKRYSPDNKIGIDIVERFLYVLDRKDDASTGMIVTTSNFSNEAKKIEKQRQYRLHLKDFESIQEWLKNDGKVYKKSQAGLWMPKV